jgi:hypothetical protein
MNTTKVRPRAQLRDYGANSGIARWLTLFFACLFDQRFPGFVVHNDLLSVGGLFLHYDRELLIVQGVISISVIFSLAGGRILRNGNNNNRNNSDIFRVISDYRTLNCRYKPWIRASFVRRSVRFCDVGG